MAIDKKDTIAYIKAESVEGTAVTPSSATDGYFQPLTDGFSITPNRDMIDRDILTGTLTKSNPRPGMKSGEGAIPVEFRGSGTEGAVPDYGVLFESLLGTKTTISAQVTTKSSGNTQTVLQIEDADIGDFAVNDGFVVLESGAHSMQFVTAVDTTGGAANITVTPGNASGAFSNSVVISKSVTYKPSDTAAASLTYGLYHGNALLEQLIGARVTSMALEGYVTGQTAKLNFGLTGLTTAQTASTAASHTPTYDSALPPVILSANIYKDGSSVCVNEFTLGVEQPVSKLMCVGNANGAASSRLSQKRSVTGSLAPYTDAASVAEFTGWDNGTAFSIVGRAYVPSSTAGEFTLGTVIGFYLPNCIRTNVNRDDLEGVMREPVEFAATGGVNGTSAEIAICIV